MISRTPPKAKQQIAEYPHFIVWLLVRHSHFMFMNWVLPISVGERPRSLINGG